MNTKVRPLSRQEVLPLAVTDADGFTALRFLRYRENTPTITELEEKGRKALPGIEGALLDLYHSLWSPEPGVKKEVPPARRYWKGLLEEAMKSSAFQELHAGTQLRELQSVLGTVSMGESVVGMVNEQDRKKLEKVAKAQATADEADAEARGRKLQADAMQNAADQAAADAGESESGEGAASDQSGGEVSAGSVSPKPGSGEPGSGKPGSGTPESGRTGRSGGSPQGGPGSRMTPEDAQRRANELARQAAEAKAEAEAARQRADEAALNAEAAADELMGAPGSKEAEQKLRELAQMGQQAIKDAKAKVQEVSSTIESWGLDPAQLSRMSIPEAVGLLERMKRSESLKKFAGLLGRIRAIAGRKARSKDRGEGTRVAITEHGRDIRRAHTSEIISLASHPALRVKALTRWTRGELKLRGEKTKKKLGDGPVIVCEDASGSMDGAKQQWAKAMVLSLAHYAKLRRRSFGWVMFDARVHRADTYHQGTITPEQMLEMVESRAGGGTQFEPPLRKALEMIRMAGLKKADICLITDGESAVSEEFLREIEAAKKALEINVFTVLCDAGSSADGTAKKFSDKIEKASTFTAEEAEAKLIRHL